MANVAPPPPAKSLPPPQSQPAPEIPTLPHPQSSPIPITLSSPVTATFTPPATNLNPTTTPTPPTPPPEPPTTNPNLNLNPKPEPTPIPIPSYSRWFSWNKIHDCEIKSLPEFFNGKSRSKTPRLYKYYRNSIIRRFRQCPAPPTSVSVSITHPLPKLTFTEARKTIVGDVGSIRRVFDFLEAWGLINYYGSPSSAKMQSKVEEKEGKANNNNEPGGGGDGNAVKKRVCSSCNSVCTIACFSSLVKKDLTLCARCYVSGGVNSSDFTRMEIREDAKTDWTDKETLQLLEGVMHYGDDWKKVAECVVGRNEKDCINRFIKLPFGEQFLGPPESDEGDENFHRRKDEQNAEFSPTKRVRLTPFADASNPIMAQAAFLSALVGVEVAEAAANAAVRALSEINSESETNNGKTTTNALEEASLQVEKEEKDLEKAISNIAEVQTKEILDKIVHFEELDFQMEREWQQVKQMQNLLFVDQLTLFHKTAGPKRRENTEEIVKPE